MKWYGFKNLNFSKKHLINLKLRNKFKTKTLNLIFNNNLNLNYNKMLFYLPSNWNFLLFKINNHLHNLLYLYSNPYYFYLPLGKSFLFQQYDSQLRVLTLFYLFTNNFYKTYWSFFKNLFYSFNKIFFKKIKFKGKGYYVYKNKRNTIALQFGYSHRVRLFFYYINVKFLSKTSILIFGINRMDLFKVAYTFKSVKPINIFTGKGIRFSKQIIYKKTGKVSSYM